MTNSVIEWTLFNVLIIILVALDLGVFSRRSHVIHVREAMLRSGVWIALALLVRGLRLLAAGTP